jgi:hypothetical protein
MSKLTQKPPKNKANRTESLPAAVGAMQQRRENKANGA